MLMHPSDPEVLRERDQIIAGLEEVMGRPEGVISAYEELLPYETDGLTAYKQVPLAVVLPTTIEEVSRVVRYCFERGVKVVPRGAGTSLAGCALPVEDGIVLGLGKMTRILEVNYDDRVAVVQAGVTNIRITQAVEHEDFFYAPDPSSQLACTIGGNVGTNSGGAHCLKYGVTLNNILGLKAVLMNGDILTLGGDGLDTSGYDLMALLIGSEGTLGIVCEITVRILHKPEGARPIMLGFSSNEDAGGCVASIIAAGFLPVAIEFMDKPAIHACEDFVHAGYPLDAEALLIIEIEGSEEEIVFGLETIRQIAGKHRPMFERISQSEAESAMIWKGRKSAFGAVGRMAPDYFCIDGTIPTGRLPAVLKRIRELSQAQGFQVANIFHAGDGNLHPLILYDSNEEDQLRGAEGLARDILKLCVQEGGCLSGEHGIGVEKRDLMSDQFSAGELSQQRRVQRAFDPDGLLNPSKVLPLDVREV